MARIASDFTCVYCTAAGTFFGTTDVYELSFSYLSISIFTVFHPNIVHHYVKIGFGGVFWVLKSDKFCIEWYYILLDGKKETGKFHPRASPALPRIALSTFGTSLPLFTIVQFWLLPTVWNRLQKYTKYANIFTLLQSSNLVLKPVSPSPWFTTSFKNGPQ